MKTTILIGLFFLFSTAVFAQNQVDVCETKTTHLIGPEKVSYLQTGDPSRLIAEIVPEHPNIVRVKATEAFSGESSLTLVCANKVYSLIVNYGNKAALAYRLETFASEKMGATANGILPGYLLKEYSSQILSKDKKHINRKAKKDGIKFSLANIYLKHDVLFFELEITNTTDMSYSVEGFHWWVDDKKQYKSTNTQEYQIEPEYQHYNIGYIPANGKLREVFVIPKLTVPDKRILRIEMLEKALGNTGRKLILDVKNKDILHAKNLK